MHLPWADEQIRPYGATPAFGWELPIGADPLDSLAAADAAVRGDTVGRMVWMRRPGAYRANLVYETDDLAPALTARDDLLLAQQARDQAGLISLWTVLGVVSAIPAISSGGRIGSWWCLMAAIFIAPAAIQWRHLRQLRQQMRVDWPAYAKEQIAHHQLALWMAGRERATMLVWAIVIALGTLALYGLYVRSTPAVAVDADRIRAGEVWRLLTGPLFHANPMHAVVNLGTVAWAFTWCAALFGRLVVVPVFVAGMLAGSLATTFLGSGALSVGISGGLLGLIGMLAVAAWRWRVYHVPGLARMVVVTLGLIAGIGVIGVGIIDNAAHAGGYLAGMLLGLAIVPAAPGPRAAGRGWLVLSIASLSLVAIGVVFTAWRLHLAH